MGPREKTFEFLVEPQRLTLGVAWQWDQVSKNDKYIWRLEISIQIPVFAVSILIGSGPEISPEVEEARDFYERAHDPEYHL